MVMTFNAVFYRKQEILQQMSKLFSRSSFEMWCCKIDGKKTATKRTLVEEHLSTPVVT